MEPSTIGRYEIKTELAQGSMGVIFLAHDPFVQRDVIVKVLTSQFVDEDYHREFFQQEAKIIASLEQPYIVMRYMQGGTLADLMKKRQLELTEFAKILQHLCDALDTAHAHNIIHRDIKPANILFDLKSQAYLADFGIAQRKEGIGDGDDWVVGTPSYMSPEQCQSQPVGPAPIFTPSASSSLESLSGASPISAQASKTS